MRDSESQLQLIIDTIPSLVWTARPDGFCDFLNQRWLHYAGMTAAQAQGWGWADAIHPDDRKGVVDYWRSCLSSGTPVATQARIRRFDGSHRWFLIAANPLRDESGKIVRWYGTNIDIEDRKRAEENLRARELSWRQIVDNIPGLVATMGAMGEVEFLNRQILEYFGKTSEELKDWALIDVVHPDDLPRVIEARIESIEEGRIYSVEHRCRRADGVYRWFQVRGLPVRNAEDAITAWYLLLTDIDDRKRAEEAIRRSEAYLAEAQRLSHTGSFGWRPDSGEIVWSDETYRIFAYDNTLKPTVDSVLQRVHPDDRALAQQVIDGACQTGSDFAHEYRLLMPDERVKHVHAIARALKDASGNCEFVGAVTDITERKTAEEKIREQEMELRQMLDLAPQSVAVFGPSGERLYANRVALIRRL
jgi:PAS domain S-box-containing protein